MTTVAKYRMTPKRRAALKAAQAASARKRRKSRNRKIAIGIGVTAGIGAAALTGFAVHNYAHKLGRGGPKRPVPVRLSTSKEVDLIRIAPVAIDAKSPGNWALVGRPAKSYVLRKRRPRKRLNYVESEKARLAKEAKRIKKNTNARRKYWRGKPVGGAVRKPRSDKGKSRGHAK